MTAHHRRDFLRLSGLAAAGGAGALVLDARAQPTAPSGSPAIFDQVRAQFGDPPALTMQDGAAPTRRSALGPFYSPGAPFRGKISPPRAPGTVLLVTGRVWAFDTKRPLPGAVLDIWHCDINGNYYNDEGDFRYRARIITSETGAYEYETIHPAVYRTGGDLRSPHIHYRVASPGYRTLVTQLFFEGDPVHDEDFLFDASLMVPIVPAGQGDTRHETAVFDIVLESEPATVR